MGAGDTMKVPVPRLWSMKEPMHMERNFRTRSLNLQ